jgi:hypothetical protein
MGMNTHARTGGRSWWKPLQMSVAEMTRDDPLAQQIEHLSRVV